MKFCLPFLMFLVIIVTLFSSSFNLSCHICDRHPTGCDDSGGGEEKDCKDNDRSDADNCVTIVYDDKAISHSCLRPTEVEYCSPGDGYRSKCCNTNGCNNDSNV